MNRKQFLQTTGAVIAGAAMTPAVFATSSVPKSSASNEYDKDDTPGILTHRFRLEKDGVEAVNDKGGSIRLVTQKEFPILKGLTIFSVHLNKGGLREPHWHPNAHECSYLISGKVSIGVLNPDGTREVVELNPGDIAYIPMGYFHYINNVYDGDSHIIVAFSHERPEDVGVSDAMGFVPNKLLGTTFGVPEKVFEGIPKPTTHVLVAPK